MQQVQVELPLALDPIQPAPRPPFATRRLVHEPHESQDIYHIQALRVRTGVHTRHHLAHAKQFAAARIASYVHLRVRSNHQFEDEAFGQHLIDDGYPRDVPIREVLLWQQNVTDVF